jgi:hypothetical protein
LPLTARSSAFPPLPNGPSRTGGAARCDDIGLRQISEVELQAAIVRKDIHTDGIPVLCVSCEARHRGICGALSPEQLVTLAKTSTKHKAEAGAELVGEAESIDHYSNVLSGVVKLTKTLPDGRQQIVGLQFAPDFLGRPFKPESVVTRSGGDRRRALLVSPPFPGAHDRRPTRT